MYNTFVNAYSEYDFPFDGKYTFVDVEIPNLNCNCICAISMIVVEDRKEVLRHTELINPKTYFSGNNIRIHGIRRKDVANARTLGAFWKEYGKYFGSDYIIAAHNTGSDISVLVKDLARIQKTMQATRYLDTMDIMMDFYYKGSQQKGDLKLNNIARRFGIYLDHHNPESDVNACYEIVRYMENYHDLDITPFIKEIPVRKPLIVPQKPIPTPRQMRPWLAQVKKQIALKDPAANIQKETAEIKGDRSFRHQDWQGVVFYYEIALAKKSRSMGIYLKLAEAYELMEMYPEAMRVLTTGINRLRKCNANYHPLRRAQIRLKKKVQKHAEASKEAAETN